MLKQVIADYFLLSRLENRKKDFLVAFFCFAIIIITSFLTSSPLGTINNIFSSVFGLIVTAFSILAGFNMTSLAILATSKINITKELNKDLISGTERPKIHQLYVYFSWAISVQLLLLFITIFYSFMYNMEIFSNKLFNNFTDILSWIVLSIIIFGIFYSICLTMRNVWILYITLLADSNKS